MQYAQMDGSIHPESLSCLVQCTEVCQQVASAGHEQSMAWLEQVRHALNLLFLQEACNGPLLMGTLQGMLVVSDTL